MTTGISVVNPVRTHGLPIGEQAGQDAAGRDLRRRVAEADG